MTALFVIGLVFAGLAALLHVYIFLLESIIWAKPATWKMFGIRSQADAYTLKPMAFNQGFYNLFLAVEAGLGVILVGVSLPVAVTLLVVGAGSMVLAALVLLSSKTMRRAALIQGAPPFIGLLFVLLSGVAS
jgi:putative membrane protein